MKLDDIRHILFYIGVTNLEILKEFGLNLTNLYEFKFTLYTKQFQYEC